MSNMSDMNIDSIFSPESNIIMYESSSIHTTSPSLITNNTLSFDNFAKLFKELLQELYIILLNTEIKEYNNIEDKLKEFTNNFLFEYELDPKNVFEIMTSGSPNIFYYSSLIGYFYQNGIGCEVDKVKAFETFSNIVNSNQNVESNHFYFDEVINFHVDIKKLNEIILRYFYFIFLYKDILYGNNYKSNIKSAEKGDSVSQYHVGNCYYYGQNIQKNYSKAFEWYSKSSKRGNIKAIYMLGNCYLHGHGIIRDKKKAYELFLESGVNGYKPASYKLGYCFKNGVCALIDEVLAFEWYLRAAKKGDGESQNLVANYYNDGKYIPKNEKKGLYWNRKAAINGNLNAQYGLANYYLNDPINKNERKAFKWYLKMANENAQPAVYSVVKCYKDGVGTDKNLDEAKKWFQKYKKYKKN